MSANKKSLAIIEKITLERSFTTEKKKTTININRKGSVVKEKCKQLINIVMRLFPQGIVSTEDLEMLVEDYCGADKTTVRAYVGYYGSIRRSKRSGEGYVCGIPRKGYLEKFSFMHPVNRYKWKVNQTCLSAFHNSEGLSQVVPIEKISFSSCVGGGVGLPSSIEVVTDNNNNNTERERNFLHKSLENSKGVE
jgi:hypothetical protein